MNKNTINMKVKRKVGKKEYEIELPKTFYVRDNPNTIRYIKISGKSFIIVEQCESLDRELAVKRADTSFIQAHIPDSVFLGKGEIIPIDESSFDEMFLNVLEIIILNKVMDI